MKKILFSLLTGIFLTGCTTTGPSKKDLAYPPFTGESLTGINHVFEGMTKSEVKTIMGESLIIGYEQKEAGVYEPITLKNPKRQETIVKDGKTYQADFYFTQIKKPDDIVSEDELTPLIFDGDKLIGKGWDFYFKLKEAVK